MGGAVKKRAKKISNFSCPVQFRWISLIYSKYFDSRCYRYSEGVIFMKIWNACNHLLLSLIKKKFVYFYIARNKECKPCFANLTNTTKRPPSLNNFNSVAATKLWKPCHSRLKMRETESIRSHIFNTRHIIILLNYYIINLPILSLILEFLIPKTCYRLLWHSLKCIMKQVLLEITKYLLDKILAALSFKRMVKKSKYDLCILIWP